MKKLYTLMALALAFTMGAQAQDKDTRLQFQYGDGTVVPDGTVVNCTTVEKDEVGIFGDFINSGLFLNNNSDDDIPTAVVGDITALPSGMVQFCMLNNCMRYGLGQVTKTGIMEAGFTDDLQLEWMPVEDFDDDGNQIIPDVAGKTATITLQVEVRNESGNSRRPVGDQVLAYGPFITINFTWPDVSGITATEQLRPEVVARYNARGERIDKAERGVNIVRLSNGKTIKQVVR